MNLLSGILLIAGLYPLCRLWVDTRESMIRHAFYWALPAWVWLTVVAWTDASAGWRYLGLCLAACAGIAVLGARRPGAIAWHFVVAGLLASLQLPFFQAQGKLQLQPEHDFFLGGVLVVVVGNYLLTRQWPAALLFGSWALLELILLTEGAPGQPWLLAGVPWLAWWRDRVRPAGMAFEQRWWAFRDRFGFLWAQRQCEQFNRAAEHARLPCELTWAGLQRGDGLEEARAEKLLAAVLGRFQQRADADSEPEGPP